MKEIQAIAIEMCLKILLIKMKFLKLQKHHLKINCSRTNKTIMSLRTKAVLMEHGEEMRHLIRLNNKKNLLISLKIILL
jgi:hypothetical protein